MHAFNFYSLPACASLLGALLPYATAFTPPGIANAASSTPISGINMHNGSSTVQFTSGPSAWDGPMVKDLNHTTFEWWYFDVLADDGQSGVVFAFFTADYKSLFPGTPNPGTAVGMAATVAMPDGSGLGATVLAEQMTVDTLGSGSEIGRAHV